VPSSALTPGVPTAPSTPAKSTVGATTPATSVKVVVLASTRTTLRRGDRGTAVRHLQLKLRAHGQHYVVADGDFGALTQRAVKVLQRAMHRTATGVANVAFLRKLGLDVVIVMAASSSPRPATPPATKYLHAFPIVGTTTTPYSPKSYPYTDVFGKLGPEGAIAGADLPAAKGTPVVSACNATVIFINPPATATALGGAWIELQDIEGTEYSYEHLNSISSNVKIGSEVKTGQAIGTVGNSGDAASAAPYLFLEVQPGGGAAVDPFPDLNRLDPAVAKA